MSNEIDSLFQQHFGAADNAFTVRAPGRVNLIGEHVDYNDGYVLPMAVPLQTLLRVRQRSDRTVKLYAANFDDWREFSLDNLHPQKSWIDYVQGVARELAGGSIPLHGFEGVITSDVPVASGLSSSAALEVASALVFTHLEGQPLSPSYVAQVCQTAENKFVGVQCGIMDQMAVAACRAEHALLLDCRTLEHEQVPLRLVDHAIVVTDSNAPRELAGSAYNERRAQCEEAVRLLQEKLPHITALRDVSSSELNHYADLLPPIVWKRASHVVEEIERTLVAVEHLRQNRLEAFGECMRQSHQSLAELYEVTSPELDWLTGWAQGFSGVLGSRMTGAGFGGCTVTLLRKEQADTFIEQLIPAYKEALNRDARCWICTAVDGANTIDN